MLNSTPQASQGDRPPAGPLGPRISHDGDRAENKEANEKGSFSIKRNCPSHGQRPEVPLTKPYSARIMLPNMLRRDLHRPRY